MKYIVMVLTALAVDLVAQIISNSFLSGSIAGAMGMLMIVIIQVEWK
jgi:hypothetical protein